MVIQVRKRVSPMFSIFMAVAILLVGTMVVTPTTKAIADAWTIVCTDNPSSADNHLFGVAAHANDAVVAVGSKSVSGQFKPLVELWSPTTPGDPPCFQERPTPPLQPGHSELYGVARAPSGSATQRTFWAVGYQGASTRTFDPQIGDWIPGGGAQTLIERTDDGGQTWSIVSSPNLTGTNVLKSVSASSADDAWAVGYYDDGTGARTLILHWDGFEWRTEPGVHEEGATDDFLYGVSAVDSTHARAVGFSLYDPPLIPSLNLQATWDGTQWVEDQNKPVPSEYYNYLFGVTAIKDNQAHAVGAYFSDATTRATQALKWFNPSVGWLQESSPNPGPVSNTFWGIAPVSSTYIWAVGSAEYSSGSPPTRTLTARRSGDVYNGTWESVTSPNVGTNKNELRAVEVVPGTSPCAGGNNWAVGYYLDSSGVAHTLAMVYTITPQCDLTP